jgi:predicted outer membrane repeat protein
VLDGNVAGGAGGAITHGGATLTVEDSVFTDNVAAGAGGALRIGAASSASIDGTLFQDNVALGTDGGAIASEGDLDVTDSAFVANRATEHGGAIASLTTLAGGTTVGASCFVGNEDAVFNAQSVAQVATGNWWGAADGPSGSGPGSGDAVSPDVAFAGFLSTPPAACLPLELVANGGFESNRDDPELPDRWRIRRLALPDEGIFCDADTCAVEIDGGMERTQLLQTIQLAGQAGDGFTLRARSSAMDVPETGGKYLVELRIVHADGSAQTRVLKFTAGSHGFEERSKSAVASESYVRLKVRVEYSRPSGSVRFDDVSVVREP